MSASFLAPQDENGTRRLDAGDVLVVTYSVTATTRLVSGVSVADPAIGRVFCPSPSVAPGVRMTCTATRTLTQGDLDAGAVVSQAVASGSDAGAAVSARAPRAALTLAATASLKVAQTVRLVRDTHRARVAEPGDALSATVVVTNTGTVSVRSVAVSLPVMTAARVAVTCPATVLAPSARLTCTSAPLTLTTASARAGTVVLVATARAISAPGSAVVSAPTSVTTPVRALPAAAPAKPAQVAKPARPAKPAASVRSAAPARTPQRVADPVERVVPRISLQPYRASVSDVDGDGVLGVGDSLTFGFLVVNTGSVTVSGVSIVDARLARLGVPIPCAARTLAPGTSTRCVSGPVFITPFQAKAGNSFGTTYAYAAGLDPSGADVRSTGSRLTQGRAVADAQETYLPQTGTDAADPFRGAVILLLLGGSLVLVGRGRRRQQPGDSLS